MLRSRSVIGVPFIVLVLCFAVAATRPLLTNILVASEGLKIVAADNFPKDMACDIYFGSEKNCRFHVKGANGKLTRAMVNVDSDPLRGDSRDPSIAVLRRETEKELYILEFASLDDDGKGYVLYDLNCDGEWDVKMTPTRDRKAFILIGHEWLQVDSVDGVLSAEPTAKAGDARYTFDRVWKKN